MAVTSHVHNKPQSGLLRRTTGNAVPFAWSGLQTLALFSTTGSRRGPSFTQTFPKCEWSPALRRLANNSFDVFASVQECLAKDVNPVSRVVFVQQRSKLYRAFMHEQVDLLRKRQGGDSGAGLRGSEEEMSRNEERLLSSWELVWHLCEALYLENLPPGGLMLQLLEWIKWHSTNADQLLSEVTNMWDAHQDYWTAVYALVVQGRMRDACKLLENHSERRNKKGRESYDRMMSLLERCPVTKSIAGITYQELVRIHSEWKLECKQRLQNGTFHESQHLTNLCNVLCGDEMAFNRMADSSDKIFPEWYHMFVGRLLFADPLVEANDSLVSHFAEVYYTQPITRPRGGVDQMILLALQGDVIELVKLCSSSFSNWWFVAHLVDLLHHLGVMEATQIQHSSQQREFLLLEYASSLMSHPSLWQLGVEYFAHCSTRGRSMLALLIERIPLTSETKTHKVLHICTRFQLKEQAQSVCRVVGVRCLKSGRLGAALQWALKAKDSELVSYIAERYMLDYERQGRLKDLVMLRNLQDDMLISPHLLFLGKYCEFARLFGEEKFSQAGSLLVELLEAGVVPKRFWITVLTDALPLLHAPDQVTLSEEQTCTLMSCLEEICLSEFSDAEASLEGLPAAKAQIGVIRLALVQNLARAILDN